MTCGQKHCQNAPTEATRVSHAEVEGRPRCDHAGCDKRVVGDGRKCADGHVQGRSRSPVVETTAQAAECLDGAGDEIARIPVAEQHALRHRLRGQHPGLDLWFSQSPGGHLVVDRIVVPKEQQGQGIGTAVMREIVAAADAYGVPMAVTPDNSFGGSVPRLRQFYRRFGFVPNQGRHKDFWTREAMVRPVPVRPAPHPPPGDAAEAEARCAYPGCGKKVTVQGRCCDGHDPATAQQAPPPIPLPECAEEGPVGEVAGVYAPLIAVARAQGFFISARIVGNGEHIALALCDRDGGYGATYLRFDPLTKRLYSGSGYSVRTQWYQARRDLGAALRNTEAGQKAAGRAMIAAVQKFREAAEWPFEELVARPNGKAGWPEPRTRLLEV